MDELLGTYRANLSFVGINFREWRIFQAYFRAIVCWLTFREWTRKYDFAGIYFRGRWQNSRNREIFYLRKLRVESRCWGTSQYSWEHKHESIDKPSIWWHTLNNFSVFWKFRYTDPLVILTSPPLISRSRIHIDIDRSLKSDSSLHLSVYYSILNRIWCR